MAGDGRQRSNTTKLEATLGKTLQRREQHVKLRSLKASSPDAIDFSSNDFLSLATTRRFREDYLTELKQSILPIGSTGSRLLDGNSEYAEALETRIALFHKAQSGLLVNSGFDANVSIFTCLPQPGDVILYDELIHASVHDGMRASRAGSLVSFRHNDVEDFEAKLESAASISPEKNIFVSVESVYSMDGDVAPLAEIVAVIKRLAMTDRCHVIVDEAHATGVYGPRGSGLVNALGLENEILVRLHTFGKALACNGAIILCSPTIKSYLINYARPLIFTTFMSYPNLTAIKVAYDWLESGKTEVLARHLDELITYMHVQLQSLKQLAGLLGPGTVSIPATRPQSAIVALTMRAPRELAAYCQANNFVVRAVMHPTVPLGTERVRICLHAGNTKAEVDALVGCVRIWLLQQVTAAGVADVATAPVVQLVEVAKL